MNANKHAFDMLYEYIIYFYTFSQVPKGNKM